MATRNRLDKELVRRGLADSVDDARLLVENYSITVGGVVALKSDREVAADEPIELLVKRRFVSRGGEKLDAALEAFGVDVNDLHVIDIGSSTGGFTDCVLQRGARMVTAIDTGTKQLDQSLREDPRVNVNENTNAKTVNWTELLVEPADLIVVDVSFASVTSLTENVCSLHVPIVCLIKPEFEASQAEASAGKGVIADPKIWQRVLETVVDSFARQGFACMGLMTSPIRGAEGNTEFLGLFTTDSEIAGLTSAESIAKLVQHAAEPRE